MNDILSPDISTITPYLTVCDASGLINFLVASFNARVVLEKRYDNNTVQHARVQIGDSILMLNESTEEYPVFNSQIHLYVGDTDAVFAKAVKLGATSIMEPNIRLHGDRMAGIKDPFGNVWWIATHV